MFHKAIVIRAFITSTIFFLVTQYCKSQNLEPVIQMINERNFDSARFLINNALKSHPKNSEVIYASGKVEMRSGNVNKAIKSYENLLKIQNVKSHIRGWTYHDLAICYYSLGNKTNAEKYINLCLQLRATKNVINSVKYSAKILGFDTVYRSWKTVATPNFIFHFQDHTINVEKFIQKKELVFNQINQFFKATLPKKIDYFVWSDDAEGSAILKRTLAFTQPFSSITHTSPSHSLGHEITHTISYFNAPFANSHKLISEGICVYFDFSQRNNISLLKRAGRIISIEAIWKNEIKVNDDIIYPLGGELIKRLISEFGREKLLQLLKNQSYENATKIYGQDLKRISREIEYEVNN